MDNSYNVSIGLDLNSVLIYLGFFIISFFFCFISEYMYKIKKKQIGYVCATLCIFVLCLLASLRSTNVGGDISVYLMPNFKQARYYNSFTDFYSVASAQMEFLFSLLVYIFAKIGNLKLLFFVIQLLILIPVYTVLYKNRNIGSITTSFIIYVLLFYNFSLSGMRQSIAMSIMFLAVYYLFEKNYRKLLFWGLIAILFHKGVIIPLILITLITLFENKKSYKRLLCVLATIMGMLFIFYNQLADLIAKLFWNINPRYSYYMRTYISKSLQWKNIPTTEIVLKFGIVFICILFGHYYKKSNVRNVSVLVFSLVGRYFVLLNTRMYEALRVAYYFDMFSVMLAGNTVYQQKYYTNRKILSFGTIGLAFLYWIYFIMYIGGYKTNIFTFA